MMSLDRASKVKTGKCHFAMSQRVFSTLECSKNSNFYLSINRECLKSAIGKADTVWTGLMCTIKRFHNILGV